jgi:DNA-binding MarR family transcriptional regulator
MPRKSADAPTLSGDRALDQSELRRHPGYFLARARFIAFRTFDEHIGEAYQLRPVEFALMVLLSSNRDVTHAQLSKALGVAPSNMTGVVRRLEVRGLLERKRANSDKRVHCITLTSAGTRLLRQAVAAGKGMDSRWMGRLSQAEQAMLVELLEKVTLAAP